MKEFLETIKDERVMAKDKLIPRVVKSIESWIQRVPNYAFDQIAVWDDILNARNLYLDLYNFKLSNQPQFS